MPDRREIGPDLTITNIAITEAAAEIFDLERLRQNWRGGEVVELIFMSHFIEPDGTTVKDFQPGYMMQVKPRDAVVGDALAVLPNGIS